MSHYWGDGFEYFGEVGEAAHEIGMFLRKYARMNVTNMKEKYGTVRVYCSFGWYQLHSITHPGYVYSQYPDWLWSFDCKYLSRVLRLLNPLVIEWQKFLYRKSYERALKKYPMIREEILCDADYPELLESVYNDKL